MSGGRVGQRARRSIVLVMAVLSDQSGSVFTSNAIKNSLDQRYIISVFGLRYRRRSHHTRGISIIADGSISRDVVKAQYDSIKLVYRPYWGTKVIGNILFDFRYYRRKSSGDGYIGKTSRR